MDESNYIGGGVSSVEYWLSWSAGRQRTIIVTLDGLFRVKLKTAGYPLHSPLSSSLLHPCVTVCHHIPFPLYLNQLRHFVFFSPPTIILWYYCTVQLNHITYCPFYSSHSPPTAQHVCLLQCRYVYLRYINVYIAGSFLPVLCVVVANSTNWTWQRSESSRHCLL